MGQKVNPIAVRFYVNRISDSSWFSDYYYSILLFQDNSLRQYLHNIKQPSANKLGFRTAKCVIHHFPKRSLIHLFCLCDSRKTDRVPEKEKVLFTPITAHRAPVSSANLVLKEAATDVGIERISASVRFAPARDGVVSTMNDLLGAKRRDAKLAPRTVAKPRQEARSERREALAVPRLRSSQKKKALVNFHRGTLRALGEFFSFEHFYNQNRFAPSYGAKGRQAQKGTSSGASGAMPKLAAPSALFALPRSGFGSILASTSTGWLKKQGAKDRESWLHKGPALGASRPFASQLEDSQLGLLSPNKNTINSFFNKCAMHYYLLKKTNSFNINCEFLADSEKFSTIGFLSTLGRACFAGPSQFSAERTRQSVTEQLSVGPERRDFSFERSEARIGRIIRIPTTFQGRSAKDRWPEGLPESVRMSLDYYNSNIQTVLSITTNTSVSLRPIKVNSVFQSAFLVAQEVACKIEQKKSFRLICRLIFQQLKHYETIKGIRITCSGRLNGAEIAKTECRKFGETSLHVFSDKIDYARAEASTSYGVLGVKVWISYI